MSDIICAISTPPGMGAIAVIRLSGEGSVALVESIFQAASGMRLESLPSHTVHLGRINDGDELLDEVLVKN